MLGHIDFYINDMFKPNRSYLSEVYRQACLSDITGSVVFRNPSLMFITAEGEPGKPGDYLHLMLFKKILLNKTLLYEDI